MLTSIHAITVTIGPYINTTYGLCIFCPGKQPRIESNERDSRVCAAVK